MANAKKTTKASTQQITVRVDSDWLPRFDRLAAALSEPGLELTRVDAIRMAIARGMVDLESKARARAAASAPDVVLAEVAELSASRRGKPVTSEAIEKRLDGVVDVGAVQAALESLCGDGRLRRVKEGGLVGYAVVPSQE